MNPKNKEPIDINIMDFKQMFDAKELPTLLNAIYEAWIKDDLCAMNNEANKEIKTPEGLTDSKTIHNKIKQCDVLSPSKILKKIAVIAGKTYMYKNKIIRE